MMATLAGDGDASGVILSEAKDLGILPVAAYLVGQNTEVLRFAQNDMPGSVIIFGAAS